MPALKSLTIPLENPAPSLLLKSVLEFIPETWTPIKPQGPLIHFERRLSRNPEFHCGGLHESHAQRATQMCCIIHFQFKQNLLFALVASALGPRACLRVRAISLPPEAVGPPTLEVFLTQELALILIFFSKLLSKVPFSLAFI